MGPIDLQPTLIGSRLKLRPLLREDFEALYQAASKPRTWEQHPDSKRYQRDIFDKRFFQGAVASDGALIIEDASSGRVIGSSRYYEWDAQASEIAIGYTFLDCDYWGTGANDELKELMLGHIFQWATVVWFHVGKDNMRSRKAVEKLGAQLSYEEARELDGVPFIQLYYRLSPTQYVDARAERA